MNHRTHLIASLGIMISTFIPAASIEQQAESHFARGQAAEKKGNAAIASFCYRLALRSSPGHEAASQRLKELSMKDGSADLGQRLLSRLEIVDLKLAQALKDIAWHVTASSHLGETLDFAVLDAGGTAAAPDSPLMQASLSLVEKQITLSEAMYHVGNLTKSAVAIEDGRLVARPLAVSKDGPFGRSKFSQPTQILKTESGMELEGLFVRLKDNNVIIYKDDRESNIEFSRLDVKSRGEVHRLQAIQDMQKTVQNTVLPVVDIQESPVDKALEQLKAQLLRIHPKLVFEHSVVTGGPSSKIPVVALQLRATSVSALLRMLEEKTGAVMEWENEKLVFRLPGAPKSSPAPPAQPVPSKSGNAALASTNQIHIWTNQTGVTINAAFVGLDGDAVVIRKDGKEFTIPFSKLNTASQELAMKLSVSQNKQ